jgi:hypothetical protein
MEPGTHPCTCVPIMIHYVGLMPILVSRMLESCGKYDPEKRENNENEFEIQQTTRK